MNSPVRDLFFCSCPPAIGGLISAIIIYSIDCFLCGPLSHVGKKVFECLPPFAHFYPASPIAVIFLVFWIVAASSHTHPTGIRRRWSLIHVVTMRSLSVTNHFIFLAATRKDMPVAQISNGYIRKVSAFASAFPQRRPGFSSNPSYPADSGKASANKTGEVKSLKRFSASAFHGDDFSASASTRNMQDLAA